MIATPVQVQGQTNLPNQNQWELNVIILHVPSDVQNVRITTSFGNTWLKQIAGNNNGLAWASYLINNNHVGNRDTYNVCYGNDANYNPFSCSDETQNGHKYEIVYFVWPFGIDIP